MTANLATIRAAVPAGVRVEPVVKANAYGHGAVPVALTLEAAGADGLSVATFDEAVELRAAGVAIPILVLYPIPDVLVRDAARLGVALTVGDEPLLTRLLDAVRAAAPSLTEPLVVQIEVETGLGRGGIAAARLAAAVASIQATPGLRLDGVWSHLAAPEDAPRTVSQVERFGSALDAVASAAGPVAPRHLAATGGLVAGAPAYEAVRPGLAIYGLPPDGIDVGSGGLASRLVPVMALRARPVRVATLPAGSGVSYGPSFETRRESRIATLPLGYGDGWSRSLSNRADALVRGCRVPLVGTVAMDAVMADVTDVPGSPVDVDDEFTLLGDQGDERIAAEDLALARDTISWEVVTAMSPRLPRVYHAAAGPLGTRTLIGGETSWPASTSGTGSSRGGARP